jgi:hypothetical protein
MMFLALCNRIRTAVPRQRWVVMLVLLVWALNSVAFCMVTARAEADAMACCPPVDCDVMASAAPQNNCCAVQSNPSHTAVSPVLLTDHVTEDAIAVAEVKTAGSAHQAGVVVPSVSPQAPPGCNSILRI